jgi:prolyl 3-hydroxylase /prolyl 3,4-dihydroxylase
MPTGKGKKRPMGLGKAGKASSTKKASLSPVFDTNLLSSASRRRIRAEHDTNGPYQHVVIDSFANERLMRGVEEEMKSNFQMNLKETDLFKVWQSDELGNLNDDNDDHDADMTQAMQNILSLRRALYSEEFRSFISDITGCNDLIERIDCSANAYTQGCHLLCHDDVIGTRRVSYIIYLTDPDDEWLPEDGGSLELYPLTDTNKQTGIPAPSPTCTILPKFNRIALFPVQPGRSYHSVQEVFSDKPRLSISGWFHGPEPLPGIEKASLSQLKALHEASDPYTALTGVVVENDCSDDNDENFQMSEEDICILRQYINPTYLKSDSMKKINEEFCKDSHIRLFDFIDSGSKMIDLNAMANTMKDEASMPDMLGQGQSALVYDMGMRDDDKAGDGKGNFDLIGPPHMRRYLRGTSNSASESEPKKDYIATMSHYLNKMRSNLIQSEAFTRYLQKITSLTPTGRKDEIRRFRPGLDYTVAHHRLGEIDAQYLNATLCFVLPRYPSDEDEEEDRWETGSVGGYECYIEQDDEEMEAAEVYANKDIDGTKEDALLNVTPANNVLNLVMRDDKTLSFVKYVSCRAPSSRWDISAEYTVKAIEDEDEDTDANADADTDEDEDEEGF